MQLASRRIGAAEEEWDTGTQAEACATGDGSSNLACGGAASCYDEKRMGDFFRCLLLLGNSWRYLGTSARAGVPAPHRAPGKEWDMGAQAEACATGGGSHNCAGAALRRLRLVPVPGTGARREGETGTGGFSRDFRTIWGTGRYRDTSARAGMSAPLGASKGCGEGQGRSSREILSDFRNLMSC